MNEGDFFSIEHDLKKYVNEKEDRFLNFRCSIIRMLSFAIRVGYERIIISGIDTSLPGYWYTENEAKYYEPMGEMCKEVLEIKRIQ